MPTHPIVPSLLYFLMGRTTPDVISQIIITPQFKGYPLHHEGLNFPSFFRFISFAKIMAPRSSLNQSDEIRVLNHRNFLELRTIHEPGSESRWVISIKQS